MPVEAKGKITVVGAGFMGVVIATLYAYHGYQVVMTDLVPGALDSFRDRAMPIASSLVTRDSELERIFANVGIDTDLASAVRGSFLVHEVIHENLESKQKLFAQLDQIAAPEAVLATNTSSFRLSEVFSGVAKRDRVIGIHYVTPAHLVKVVEILVTDFVPPALVDWVQNFLKTIDHVGIVCVDEPGFVVNRLQYALLAEAYSIVEQGIASREDVDKAFRLSLGPRLALWGPLLTEDLVVSKKTVAAVWDYLFDRTGDEKFKRPPQVTRFVEEGKLGAASGSGWYDFGKDNPSVVGMRDRQLKSLLKWLEKNDRLDDFKIS